VTVKSILAPDGTFAQLHSEIHGRLYFCAQGPMDNLVCLDSEVKNPFSNLKTAGHNLTKFVHREEVDDSNDEDHPSQLLWK
jgi:hypothetical protein